MLKLNDKGYIPKYGWFGRLGAVVDATVPYRHRLELQPKPGDTVWFYPDHTNDGYMVKYRDIEPYEWLSKWDLRAASRKVPYRRV